MAVTSTTLEEMPTSPVTDNRKLAAQNIPRIIKVKWVSLSLLYIRIIEGDQTSAARCTGIIDRVRTNARIVPKVAPSEMRIVSTG
jgi:hypothetical protein